MKETANTQQKFTYIQKQILYGILLGDANLRTQSQNRTYSLRVLQKKEAYAKHLEEIFAAWVKTGVKPSWDEKKRVRYYFNTRTSTDFQPYGQQFYKIKNNKKVKCVPWQIYEWLTPRAIAYWLMDDGAAKWRTKEMGMRFCTDCFTYREVETLCDEGRRPIKHKIHAKPQKHREGQYRVYVGAKSAPDLARLTLPYIHPSMYHKIPLKWFSLCGSIDYKT